jgi:hypothetical protein
MGRMPERDPSEYSRDPAEFRPARESSPWLIVVVLLVLVAGAAGWWYWSQQRATPPPAPAAMTPQPDSPPAPAAPPTAAATGPQNPIDALAPPDAALPSLADSNAAVAKALTDLLSAKSVASFLQIDDFVRRFVATVDNLPRAQAPSRMWPTQPAPQRFEVAGAGSGSGAGTGEVQTIDAANAGRYTAFIAFADSIDSAKAVAVYAHLYPLFQQAYEELGYPGKYFNDRLVAVIDHLLQAPEPQGPLQVKLTEVKGSVPSSRPWTRYEFADPQLEALSSGQKLLVRMGPENERRMKAKLRAVRGQVATGEMAKR